MGGAATAEAAPAPGIRIAFIGHATLLIELDGVRILTDPLLSDRLGPLRRHGPSPDVAGFGALDAVLISHAHPDHFHQASLRRLSDVGQMIVPVGLGRVAGRLGPTVDELAVGSSVQVGGVRVTAVPALHMRWPLRPSARTIGYLIEGTRGIYFAGDTKFFAGMSGLAGRVDVALLPVGRWGPHSGPDRLSPRTAARAARAVGANVAIPIHWGTFYPAGLGRVLPRPLRQPATLFAAALMDLAPEIEARVLEPGGSTAIPATPPPR